MAGLYPKLKLFLLLLLATFVSPNSNENKVSVNDAKANLVSEIRRASRGIWSFRTSDISERKSDISEETIENLAEVLAWFYGEGNHTFQRNIFETIFGPDVTLTDQQIQTVLYDFKTDDSYESLINKLYSHVKQTKDGVVQNRVMEKSKFVKKFKDSLKKSLQQGFTLMGTLNKLWTKNYECYKALSEPMNKWKNEEKVCAIAAVSPKRQS